jgi:hypothetical protein
MPALVAGLPDVIPSYSRDRFYPRVLDSNPHNSTSSRILGISRLSILITIERMRVTGVLCLSKQPDTSSAHSVLSLYSPARCRFGLQANVIGPMKFSHFFLFNQPERTPRRSIPLRELSETGRYMVRCPRCSGYLTYERNFWKPTPWNFGEICIVRQR